MLNTHTKHALSLLILTKRPPASEEGRRQTFSYRTDNPNSSSGGYEVVVSDESAVGLLFHSSSRRLLVKSNGFRNRCTAADNTKQCSAAVAGRV